VGLIGHSLGGYTVLGLAGGWPSWRRPEVKAVLAWSPYCAPFLAHGDLVGLRVPVMYQGGTIDLGITPSVVRPGGCFDRTASPTYLVELEGAGHFAWTNLNHRFDDTITAYSIAFLRKYLEDGDGAALGRQRPDVAWLRGK
jgi:predicted dienelactone hydrolase